LLRRPFIFSLVLSLALLMSFSSKALAGDQRWLALSVNDRVIVDRLASDLFRTHIYVNQISAPEWRYLNPAQKAPFRRNAMDILGAQASAPPQRAPAPYGHDI